MVRLLVKKKIHLLLAKRNLMTNKKTTLVIIFTLSLLFAIFIMMLGIRGIYRDLFIKEAKSKYPNIDIVITYDEYSRSRLINKRNLVENYEDVSYALAFFNLQVLTESSEGKLYYTNMLSSMPYEFELFIDKDIEIDADQAIITKSYAQEKNLSVGDKITIYILDMPYEFEVKEIFQDSSAFKGMTFFVDKSSLLEKIYNVGYLDNFGNQIYVKTENIEADFQRIITDEVYSDYKIELVVDEARIDALVSEYVSIIILAGLIVLFSLVVVLNSLFVIVLRDIYYEMSVLNIIGDEKKQGYKIATSQWFYYIFISFLAGVFIAHLVVNVGGIFYGVDSFIFINPLVIIGTLLIIMVLVFIKNILLVSNEYKNTSVANAANKRFANAKYNLVFLILLSTLLLLLIFIEPFSRKTNSLIIVVVSLYLSMTIVIHLFKYLSLLFSKKRSSFRIFNLSHIKSNRHIHQSLSVVFLSFIVVAIMLTVRFFIAEELNAVINDNKYDILMVNLYDYEENLVEEVRNLDVESADQALVYQDIYMNIGEDEKVLIKNFVSLEETSYQKYFDFELIDSISENLNDDLPKIYLPYSFADVYDYRAGDLINLDLAPDLKNIDFVIAGFINTSYDHFVYSDIYEKIPELNWKFNTIFINAENTESALDDLIANYSSSMYYFIDVQEQLDQQLELTRSVLALFTVITIFIILSFMFVVYNNTLLKFYSLKSDYAKVMVLGITRKKIKNNLNIEFAFMILSMVIVGLIEAMILSKNFKNVLLFFDYYKNIEANYIAIIIAYISIFTSLYFSYKVYFNKLKTIDVTEETKVF